MCHYFTNFGATFTVENGEIKFINNIPSLDALAVSMAKKILCDCRFPKWDTVAYHTLHNILFPGKEVNYARHMASELGYYQVPATKEVIIELNEKLENLYTQFRLKYAIPEILANGKYHVVQLNLETI